MKTISLLTVIAAAAVMFLSACAADHASGSASGTGAVSGSGAAGGAASGGR